MIRPSKATRSGGKKSSPTVLTTGKVVRQSLLDLKRPLTRPEKQRLLKAVTIARSAPKKSPRGRKPDERLRQAWIEWEMSPPGEANEKGTTVQYKRPTYFELAKKYFGNGRRFHSKVKKEIQRLHRKNEEDNRRGREIKNLLSVRPR